MDSKIAPVDVRLSTILVARRVAAAALSGVVFAIAIYFAYQRYRADRINVFVYSPVDIVVPGHREQAEEFERIVPKGSAVFYLMDKFEGWQSGLWQRSLYPDYEVIEVSGLSELQNKPMQRLRAQKRIEYVLAAGNPPLNPGFVWQVALPRYPNDIPVLLGKLPAQ